MTDLEVKNLIGDPKGNPTENTMSHLPAILDYLLKKGVDPTILAKKADKVVGATAGNIPVLDSEGNLQDGNVTSTDLAVGNHPFPSDWHTTGTMSSLISDINADDTAIAGMSYLATVSYSDLPEGLLQAELKAEVLEVDATLGKTILFTVTNNTTAPYHWEYISVRGQSGSWYNLGYPTTIISLQDYTDLSTKDPNMLYFVTV